MADSDQELSRERFGFTVFLSACVHAILIFGVTFTYLEEMSSEAAMEVTLAQYRSELAPEDADFLAQENQVGSGSMDQALAPSTPFESDFHDEAIREVRPLPEAPQLVNEVEITDTAVISSVLDAEEIRQQLEELEQEPDTPSTEEISPDELSVAIASLQAQLDLRRQAYAKRPRRYTISSASTKQSHDALYLDNWRRRIEAVGNLNYPDAARALQLYGSLRMMVTLRPNGEVEDISILRSSGHNILDQAAVDIVNLAAPFDPFPEAMRAEADILEIIRTWRFHEGNALTSF